MPKVAKPPVVGYMVRSVDDDTSVKDLLWEFRTLYSTWENAVRGCEKSIATIHEYFGEDIKKTCFLNQTSKNKCDKDASCHAYSFQENGVELANVYIMAVYSGDTTL